MSAKASSTGGPSTTPATIHLLVARKRVAAPQPSTSGRKAGVPSGGDHARSGNASRHNHQQPAPAANGSGDGGRPAEGSGQQVNGDEGRGNAKNTRQQQAGERGSGSLDSLVRWLFYVYKLLSIGGGLLSPG